MTATAVSSVLDQVAAARIVPVVTIKEATHARTLGDALLSGGLPLAEITFRTEAAADAIRVLRESHPDVLVGAGTVLDPATVDRAVDAGAAFVVAPGFSPRVVDHCLDRGIPVVPGVCTPTEIELGLERGLTLLKFFPAEASGGLSLLSAIATPYRVVRFMATGGISPTNLGSYLASPWIAACGGTWLATAEALAAGDVDAIEARVREALDVVRSVQPHDQ
jgi:2-dehydro-3-deoxyphosphogluconate aldolase/(4S)-4-hydroxy-2-oxoglutarate aldolase